MRLPFPNLRARLWAGRIARYTGEVAPPKWWTAVALLSCLGVVVVYEFGGVWSTLMAGLLGLVAGTAAMSWQRARGAYLHGRHVELMRTHRIIIETFERGGNADDALRAYLEVMRFELVLEEDM